MSEGYKVTSELPGRPVSMFKLTGVYKNISTAVELLLYCFVELFFPPTDGLYTCKEFTVHGTTSSYVVF